MAEQEFSFDWLDGDRISEAEWDFIYGCYANTYAVRGQLPYLTRDFFSLLAALSQCIRVVLARRQGKPVAMAFYLTGGVSLFGRY